MRIACRRHGLCVTEELSDYRKAETYTSGHAREAMAKVMNTHVVETGANTDTAPSFLKVDQVSAFSFACYNVRIARYAWHGPEQTRSRVVEVNRLRARF